MDDRFSSRSADPFTILLSGRKKRDASRIFPILPQCCGSCITPDNPFFSKVTYLSPSAPLRLSLPQLDMEQLRTYKNVEPSSLVTGTAGRLMILPMILLLGNLGLGLYEDSNSNQGWNEPTPIASASEIVHQRDPMLSLAASDGALSDPELDLLFPELERIMSPIPDEMVSFCCGLSLSSLLRLPLADAFTSDLRFMASLIALLEAEEGAKEDIYTLNKGSSLTFYLHFPLSLPLSLSLSFSLPCGHLHCQK